MNKITITIPDNLSHQEELLAIAQQLGKKLLPTSAQKLLGTGYTIKDMETQINIKREAIEKPIVTCECGVCETIFEKNLGSSMYVNYGGTTTKKTYCSDDCREVILSIVGEGRGSIKRNGLAPIRTF